MSGEDQKVCLNRLSYLSSNLQDRFYTALVQFPAHAVSFMMLLPVFNGFPQTIFFQIGIEFIGCSSINELRPL
jgi:hypothetical protein